MQVDPSTHKKENKRKFAGDQTVSAFRQSFASNLHVLVVLPVLNKIHHRKPSQEGKILEFE